MVRGSLEEKEVKNNVLHIYFLTLKFTVSVFQVCVSLSFSVWESMR